MNHFARLAVLMLAFVAALLAPDAQAARKAKELLQYIPAETPYVIAYTKPLPDDLRDRFEPAVEKVMSAYRRMLNLKMAEEMDKHAGEERAEELARLQALMDEMFSLLSVESLREAGVGRDALFAIYGDGMLPVIRIALSDKKKFEAAIERIEAKLPEKFGIGTIDGQSFRYRDIDRFRVVITTPGKDAVIALVPSAYSDDRLAQTLGLDKPRKSLAKTEDLRNLAREYNFTDHFLGYIDVEAIVASFTGDPDGLNAELLQIVGHDPSSLTPGCRTEFTEAAAIAPRVVMGYSHVGDDYLDSELVIELRKDIAAGLAALPAVVPGLGSDSGGLFSFGMSLNPLALRNFYEARLDAMEADPFECEAFADIQASTVEGRQALEQPIPPVVYSFRGFVANVSDVQGMDIAREQPPESVDAGVLLAMENTEALVTMAAMMSPQIAALNLLPDSKARALVWPQLEDVADQAFAALSAGGVSVSIGEGSKARVEAMLSAPVDESRPLMSFAMDAGRYYEFVTSAAMTSDVKDGDTAASGEMRAAIRDVMISSGEVYERMAIQVHLTERGVEIGSRITLTDPD